MKNVKVAHPYTQDDKDLLLQLINTYPIIETKKTDATSIKKKTDAWSKVTSEYNCSGPREKRTVIQLKRCWDKIKRKKKGDTVDESRNISPGSKDLITITSYIDDTIANTCDPIISQFNENVRCKQKNGNISDDVNSGTDNYYATRSKNKTSVSVDRLLECRIKNTIVERERSEQIHNLQLEIEREKLKQAIADRQAAEMNAQIKKVQLEEHTLQLKMLKKQFDKK